MENPVPHPPEAAAAEDNINLRHYWHVILERRWLVITAFVSVFVLSLIYLYKAPRIFQAVARMQIDKESENILNVNQVLSFEGREQDYLQTQYKNLQSRSLIESVMKRLNLEQDERYAKEIDKPRAILNDITIAPIRLSRLVDVKVEHTNPQKAARIANALVEKFIDNNLDLKMMKSTDVWRWLKSEAETLATKVEQADSDLQKYREKENSVSLEASQNIVLQALLQAQTELGKEKSESESIQAVASEIRGMIEKRVPLEALPQVANDISIKELQATLSARQQALEALLVTYKDKWPAVKSLKAEILKIEQDLKTHSERIVESVYNNAKLAKAREDRLRALVNERSSELMAHNQTRINYDVLARKAEQSRLLYSKVLATMQETEITGKSKSNNMRVVDLAKDPLKPIKPRIMLTLFLGLFGGLATAIGLAFFVNYLDDSIKSQDDVETYLRLPFLGYVPNIKTNSLVERDLQAHLHPRSTAAEGFRTIRAAISLMPKADKFRLLSVTSTIPSEGKSLVAANLAVVNAQTGLKTVLVDADLRRPSVHKAFQLHSPIGLSSYLTEEVNSIDEFIHSTEVPNLDVICCGAIPSTPSELIGSKRMMQFMQELRNRYDRVILDCPPVSAVSDPLVLAARSDGVVFITKFNKIRREHARRTVQRLQDSGIFILGVVLNDIDFEGKDSYYYSYYYYQNRYYASHYKSDRAEGGGTGGGEEPKAKKTKTSA